MMFAKIRSLLQQSAVYGLGTIAARAVAFLLLRKVLNVLSREGSFGAY